MRKDTTGNAHGPDWKTGMSAPSRPSGLEAEGAPCPSVAAGLRYSTPVCHRRRRPGSEKRGSALPTAGEEGGGFSLARGLARKPWVGRMLAYCDGDAAEIRSAPGAQGRRTEMSSFTTPPLQFKAGGVQSDSGVVAPRHYPLELSRAGPVGGWAAGERCC